MGGGSDQGPLGIIVDTDEIEDGAVTPAKTSGVMTAARRQAAPQDITDVSDSKWTTPTTCSASSVGNSLESGPATNVTTSSGWTVSTPDNLANARDGDFATMTGIGRTDGTTEYITWDFGQIYEDITRVHIKYSQQAGASGTNECQVQTSTNGSAWSGSIDTKTVLSSTIIRDLTITIAATDIRYVRIQVRENPGGANDIQVRAYECELYIPTAATSLKDSKANPTALTFKTDSEINAWVKADFASAQEILAIGVHLNEDTDATVLELYVSADDVTYTKVRKTAITHFVDDEWNLWYFNRQRTLPRYAKIQAGDAGAKILAVNEIVGLIFSESAINREHFYKTIDEDDTTLDLEGD